MKRLSMLRRDKKLRDALKKRFEDLQLNYKMVIDDAGKFGVFISSSALSRYFRNEPKDIDRNILTEFQLQWLSARYCIDVNLTVHIKAFQNNKGLTNAQKIHES